MDAMDCVLRSLACWGSNQGDGNTPLPSRTVLSRAGANRAEPVETRPELFSLMSKRTIPPPATSPLTWLAPPPSHHPIKLWSNNNKNLIGKVKVERLTSTVDTAPPPWTPGPINKLPSTL